MFDLEKNIRPNIRNLKPYQSARDEFAGLAEVALDANENPFGFGLNRYPDAGMKKLKSKFAAFRGVKADRLIFGNGSDEIIDLLIRTFCEPGNDQILIFPPTFGMYRVCANINNVGIIEKSQTAEFQIDFEQLRPSLDDPSLKLIFICSPNNPTGNTIEKETIVNIAKSFDGIVVLDEAYIDFGGASMIDESIPNLFILQTFSKALGLAGIRLGVGIGASEVIAVLNKVKPPYNINTLTQQRAVEALSKTEETKRQVASIVSERDKLSQKLSSINGIRNIYPSKANFLLVEIENAALTYTSLCEKGIIVRDRSKEIENTLRITVGSPDENARLIAALREEDHVPVGRVGKCVRSTSETQILADVNLDDPSNTFINTGIPFFDHMLEQIARHGSLGLNVISNGDLYIDPHHTIEDTALALGSAFNDALGERKGIERYGFLLPMDDSLAQVGIDFGGRPWLEWEATFRATHVGEMPTEMVSHFFKSFTDTARCNLNIKVEGDNDHHKIESIFKAFARAIKMAVRKDESGILPSTKGKL